MRLISLNANVKGFHDVRFNEQGLSLVVGTRTEDADHAGEKTTNGVGKSLTIYLVNFCLGSSQNPALERSLSEWAFTLTFSVTGGTHVATRHCSDQGKVVLDDEEISLDRYTKWLGEKLFRLDPQDPMPYLTFRSLIGNFLRPTRAAYDSFDAVNRGEQDYAQLLRAAYLLDLDVGLVQRKRDTKVELTEQSKLQKSFESDVLIRNYLVGERDLDVDVATFGDEVRHLEQSVADFRVAEDYHDIEEQANQAKRGLQGKRNDAHTIRRSLAQIEESLGRKLELSPIDVQKTYEEAQTALPDSVLRGLEEVQEFHRDLLSKRTLRLTREREQLQRDLSELERRLKAGGAELDQQLGFLQTHGALDEYQAISATLAEKRSQLSKLESYKELLRQYKIRVEELKIRMSEDSLAADRHLEEAAPRIKEASDLFRKLTHSLYEKLGSVLTVENNTGDNQKRFNIEAKIESDSSDGINEAKIFAYDMMLSLLGRNHRVGFLCHDSRLFADMDSRQRALALKLAHYCSTAAGVQYIATFNDDQTDPLREYLDEQGTQFDDIVTTNVVLRLTDDSPLNKLLGKNVDLKYDEKEK